MKRSLLYSAVLAVAVIGLVALRRGLRNSIVTSVNRRRVGVDHTGNRTNDIPSRRGELPVDLH
jgi:hypothetical protein